MVKHQRMNFLLLILVSSLRPYFIIMEMTKEEFEDKFRETLDSLLEGMAENSEIDLKKFYGMAYYLENLAFFSPVIYGIIKNAKK